MPNIYTFIIFNFIFLCERYMIRCLEKETQIENEIKLASNSTRWRFIGEYRSMIYPLIYDLGSSECDASRNWSSAIRLIASVMRNLEDYLRVGNERDLSRNRVRWFGQVKLSERRGEDRESDMKKEGRGLRTEQDDGLAGSRKHDRRHCTRGTFPSFGEARNTDRGG